MAIQIIPFSFPGLPGIRCAFTTRLRGCSSGVYTSANMSFDVGDDPVDVRANRQALQQALGFQSWTECKQVHGDATVFDPDFASTDAPGAVEADGMATTEKGRGLVIKTADCQPVFLAHQDGGHIMALHVGWRGNRIGYIGAAIAQFCDHYGLLPGELLAVRGPSLGPASSEFVNYETEWGADFARWYDARSQKVDLWRLTRDQLLQAGLPAASLYTLDLCTACLPSHFYSYRMEKKTGRMANVIWIT